MILHIMAFIGAYILGFIPFMGFIYIIKSLHGLSDLLREKSNMIKAETSKIEKETEEPIEMSRRIDTSSRFLKLLDAMIENEIDSFFSLKEQFNIPYDVLKIDKDIQELGTKVFNAVKKDIYTNEEFVFTEDMIFNYISTRTVIMMFYIAKKKNLDIYGRNT